MDFLHLLFCNVKSFVIGIDAIQPVHSVSEINKFFDHRFAGGRSNYDLVTATETFVRLYKNELAIFYAGHQAIAHDSYAIGIWVIAMYV
ncbi:hypothetical protein PMI37_01884 [Pseudomonas sp. GM80]|nr:hypothetical protein PMI37_01884 [Pseudomonas sp. GM80]